MKNKKQEEEEDANILLILMDYFKARPFYICLALRGLLSSIFCMFQDLLPYHTTYIGTTKRPMPSPVATSLIIYNS